MKDFFSRETETGFELLATAHVGALIAAAVILLLLTIGRHAVRRRNWNNRFRYGLAVLLIVCEASLQLWSAATGDWSWKHSLPLQLCSMMLLLSAVMLWRRSYRLFEFVYFAGIAGALQALATPDLDYGFPHFRFLLFMIAHIAIIAASLYMVAVEGYRPKFRSVGVAMLWLNVCALVAYGVNSITGANYMFLMRKPAGGSLLDLLGPWPWYLLVMEAVALVLFLMLYLPFAFANPAARQSR